jgi:hypothetical protein
MDFDSLRHKAESVVTEHGDQIEKALDTAEKIAKDRTSGHDQQIDKGVGKLKDLIPGGE